MMRVSRSGRVEVRWAGEPPVWLAFPALAASGVPHAFTTRHHARVDGIGAGGGPFGRGGAALAALGVEPASVRFARQVHGTTCLTADGVSRGLVGEGDALLTAQVRQPLAVFTADCLPVLLADVERGVLAAAHAGWRGTVGGILGRVVDELTRRFGARPEALQVAIGPSIGPCCYEVDAPVMARLAGAFPEAWTGWARPGRPDHYWLDLWQANADQLADRGVRPEAILNPRLCTSCRRDVFFSYRAGDQGARLALLALLA